MKIRKGDKLICIKDRYSFDFTKIYTKGELYIVKDFNDNTIYVSCKDDYIGHYMFYIYGNSDNEYLFIDYFIKLSEMRKRKLKNIENEF